MESEWIYKRLQPKNVDILGYIPKWTENPIQVIHRSYDGLCFETSDGEFNFGISEVTHWMPLPDPPKEF